MAARQNMYQPWQIGLLVETVRNPFGATCSGALPHWCASLTLDGAGDYGRQSDGPRFVLERGDFMLIRVHTPQFWRVVSKCDWQVTYSVFDPRPHWLPWLNWEEFTPGYAKIRLDENAFEEIRRHFAEAERLDQSGQPGMKDFVYNAVERALLLAHRRYQRSCQSRIDPRVEAALQILNEDLAAPLTLDELARRCHLSRAQLALLFKRQVGVGPIEFQSRQRLERARQLLKLPFLSVKQIAGKLGYANPKYFSTCFRRAMEMTPQEYRRNPHP